jgi:AbiJ N-terminal domain 3/TIR domain
MTDQNRISRETRRNVVDWLRVEGVDWAGRLSDEAFLDRVIDLDSLPSTDPRYDTARQDLRQHREFNPDWQDDWVFSYSPISLLDGSDELFAKFLTESLHPVVRPDSDEARRLAAEFSDLMAADSVELYESSSIGRRPVWALRTIAGSGTSAPPLSDESVGAEALDRIWERDGLLRLFLSHVSAHKVEVGNLKRALRIYGVSAFVAHEDIEPTLEWQSEIQLALTTAHSLAALITPDFHDSNWTDQEVGIALGRGIFVFGIRLPTAPYGFIGRLQGLPGNLSNAPALAVATVDILLMRSETSVTMREALVVALETSANFADSNLLIPKIEAAGGFSAGQLARMSEASTTNVEVSGAFAVNRLRTYLSRVAS